MTKTTRDMQTYRNHKWFEPHRYVQLKLRQISIVDEKGKQIDKIFSHLMMCTICGELKEYRTKQYA